jgi:HemY protein
MRHVFMTLVAAALAVVVAWWIASLPGTVSVSLGAYTVQTSTALALLGALLLVLVLYALLRALAWVLGTPRRIARWRARRRRREGDAAVTRALVALAAGDQDEAPRQANRARRLLGDTPQTLLLAAEASRLAGNDAGAADLFKLLAGRDDAAFLGLRGLFRQALAREDWSAATALARQAEAVNPGGAWLRDERTQLAVRTGDWRQALALASPEAPLAAYATAAADAETDADEGTRLARQAYKEHPGFVPAALAYARRLRAAGREAKALDVIRSAWAAAPHPDLAAFVLAPITDKLARVKEAGRLVQANPQHAESRLLLARLSLEAGLTGEARRLLDLARAAGLRQKRLWILLADLEAEERGDTEAGRLAQRDALRQAATAEADPAWRCATCGSEHAAWLPVCPACHTPGRIGWDVVPRLALPAP